MSGQSSDNTKQWGKPLDARRWHIFNGKMSLCGNWAYGAPNQDVDPNEDSYREGEDCKECCRKAGVLDS